MNPTIHLLNATQRTTALQCLTALWAIGPLPVTQQAVVDATGESTEAVRKGLLKLQALGYASCSDDSRKSGWQLTPAAQQLALPLVLPALESVLGRLQAGVPDDSLQTKVQPASADNRLLQVSAPVDADFADSNPQNLRSRGASIIIIPNTHQEEESSNKNNKDLVTNPQNRHPKNRTPNVTAEESKRSRHISDIARALSVKGVPRLQADDLLPPALRLCAERLVAIGCSRKRAELVVARSPWDNQKIFEQIEAWKRHKASPYGRGIIPSQFPYLVACRLEAGEECPTFVSAEDHERLLAEYEDLVAPAAPESDPAIPQPPVEFDVPQTLFPEPASEATRHWQAALEQLALETSRSTFDTWLAPTRLVDVTNDVYLINVPTTQARDWLTNRMADTVRRTLSKIAGRPIQVRFDYGLHTTQNTRA